MLFAAALNPTGMAAWLNAGAVGRGSGTCQGVQRPVSQLCEQADDIWRISRPGPALVPVEALAAAVRPELVLKKFDSRQDRV